VAAGWKVLREGTLELLRQLSLAFIAIGGLAVPLLLWVVLRALWAARLGPAPYWDSFRCYFATGCKNIVLCLLTILLDGL
jgi:hypothetical protein